MSAAPILITGARSGSGGIAPNACATTDTR
ncbi:hypothetical protein A8U91_03594 [Halomonas elongata]|uniref:Uncharacterized protein n=1 Tax=Halomonas elongata TaxID=2746 RepID=A0A1B8NX22_HALEL|nr:hypothetical protein A8U91_03594 [Halomonas elongata]